MKDSKKSVEDFWNTEFSLSLKDPYKLQREIFHFCSIVYLKNFHKFINEYFWYRGSMIMNDEKFQQFNSE